MSGKTKAKRIAPSKAGVKTVETEKKKCMVEYITVNIFCLLVFLAFGYIALMAFFQTSVIDSEKYVSEKILFVADILPLNLLFTVLCIAAMFGLKRFFDKRIQRNYSMRRTASVLLAVMIALTAIYTAITIIFAVLAEKGDPDSTKSFTDIISEKIGPKSVFFPMNILLTVLFVGLLLAAWRFYDYKSKRIMTVAEGALAAFVIILGLTWVLSARSIPAADSYNIFEAATDAAQGEYTSMQNYTNFYNSAFYNGYSYFHFYPFQLGYVGFCEIVYRIFGTDSSMPIQIINVLSVGASYFALVRMTRLLFKSKRIEFIAIILLALCLQPVLFCTFAYGNLLGMCFAIWASMMLIKYFQSDKYVWAIAAGVLLVLATLIKYNNMIYLVAFVIMLIIHIFKNKKWQSAVIAAAFIAGVIGSNALIIAHYESRSGTDFAEGVSQTLYLDMGMQESYMAPGWYTNIAKDTYINYYLKPKFSGNPNASIDDANEKAMSDIENRLDVFSESFNYSLEFFSQKILSQWNEPTFESIWVSKVKAHTANETQQALYHTETVNSDQMEGLAKDVYSKSTGQFLELHFNFYMQILFIMFAAGIYLLFINKKTNIETVLLPLVILGAFGYHLLFEGKSQYILTYIPLMIPTAAYGISAILNGKYTKLRMLFSKLNSIPGSKKQNAASTQN